MTNPNGRPSGIAWTDLAETDRSVARQLAGAERSRMATSDRIADQDAAADRSMRLAEQRLRLDAERQRDLDDRRERRQQQRERAKADRRGRRLARRRATAAAWNTRVAFVRDNAAAVYSGTIYSLAVSGAVYGQVDAAVTHGMPWPVGAVTAVAIEGTGLSMALTAQEQRLRGERAIAARSLVWAATGAAVAINYVGHAAESPTMAYGLAALSALGITVWEVRSAAKHRKALREAGMIPEPMERYGWRRWIAHFGTTRAAWRLDVRERVSEGAARLIAQAEAEAVEAAARAVAERAAAEVAKSQRVAAEQARRAAKAAVRRGESGPTLVALLALSGNQQMALPAAPTTEPTKEAAPARLKSRATTDKPAVRPKRHLQIGRPRKGNVAEVASFLKEHPNATVAAVAHEFRLSDSTARRRVDEAKKQLEGQ